MLQVSKEFQSKIKERIQEIEKKTSVEFVPVIVSECSEYLFFRLMICFQMTAIAVLLLWRYGEGAHFWLGAFVAVGVAVLTFLLVSWRPLLTRILPQRLKHAETEDAAYRVFLKEEIFLTKERTGVLIFISELEKSVFLLADKGLREKVPDREWKELGEILARDFKKKSAGQTFLEALNSLATRLAPHFPPREVNLNELPDELRTH